MDKELIIKNAKNRFKGKLLDLVLEQIKNYYKLDSSNYILKKKYNIGDEVVLTKNNLLHGIRTYNNLLDNFASRGVICPNYLTGEESHAFSYVSAFWGVYKNIKLKDFIINYSGMIVNYDDKYVQVPYGKLDNFVEKMKKINHFKWNAESSMEIRFMPSLAKNDNQIGFILNTENKIAKKMRSNTVFKKTFNKEYSYEFVSEVSKEKFLNEGFVADFFERADYIIFGLPACCIEGIIVGRKFERNRKKLKKLKKLFSNCYIANLDGKVIID